MFEDRGVMSRGWVSDATVFDGAAGGNHGRVRGEAAKDDQAGDTLATGRLVPMMGAVAVDPGGGTVRVAVLRSMGPSPEELSHPSVDADDVAGGKLLLKDAGMEDAGEHL
jgi:hypothetical protein